jgi:undecaprenyl diphosphate synthase
MGDIEGLPVIVRDTLNQARSRTADCTGLRLVFAVNYGGRQDIVGACRRIATQVAEGGISPSAIDEGLLSASLFAAEAGDLDLIIRTSGESRLSNFMLWQAAYAELYFVDKHWPDFTTKDFAVAIDNFRSRERRFGKTADQLQPSVRFEHVVASP